MEKKSNNNLKKINIKDLNFSINAHYILKSIGIDSLYDLVEMIHNNNIDMLISIKLLDENSYNEIMKTICEFKSKNNKKTDCKSVLEKQQLLQNPEFNNITDANKLIKDRISIKKKLLKQYKNIINQTIKLIEQEKKIDKEISESIDILNKYNKKRTKNKNISNK